MSTKRRVLIVDDHAATRAGFAALLADVGLGLEVAEAATADAALQALRNAGTALLILDLGLPGRSGLDLLRHVHGTYPDLPVLVLSGYPERQYAMNVLRAGACGYLSKSCSPEDLEDAVTAVLGERRYVSASAAEMLIDDRFDGARPRHATLSQREFDIFLKIAGGTGVSEVAGRLNLSVKTVSTYRSRILQKMAMRTNADLTRYALENELIH